MHALGIALQRQQGVHAIASDRRVDFDTWPGTLSYTPPGVEVFSESATGGEYLVLRYAAHEADAPGPSRRISQHGQRSALQMAQHLRLLLLSPSRTLWPSSRLRCASWPARRAAPAGPTRAPAPAMRACWTALPPSSIGR
jgi:hypothetical protein